MMANNNSNNSGFLFASAILILVGIATATTTITECMVYGIASASSPVVTVAPKVGAGSGRFPFPLTGPAIGTEIVRQGNVFSALKLKDISTYQIEFILHTVQAGQVQLELNGVGMPSAVVSNFNPTTGDHLFVGMFIITTTEAHSVIALINPIGNSVSFTLTQSNTASTHGITNVLTVKLIQGVSAAMFYGLTLGSGNTGSSDYLTTIAVKTGAGTGRVPFPRVYVNPAHATNSTDSGFILPVVGTYEISFRVHTVEPGQLQLELNNVALPETVASAINPTSGGHVIYGSFFVTTTTVNSILAVINPAGNTPALTVAPALPGIDTTANTQTLCIKTASTKTGYANFFGLTTGTGNLAGTDYSATIAPKTSAGNGRVPFPRPGPAFGGNITYVHNSISSFRLAPIGNYEVSWMVDTTDPGQLQLELNGVGLNSTVASSMDPTSGGHQIIGNFFIQTTSVNSTLAVINPPVNTAPLTITPADGARTQAHVALLTIRYLGI